MTRKQAIRKRERLAAQLSSAADVLRGSLLQRSLRHSSGCSKCARGEGHPLWVLTVGYPGGKNRQMAIFAFYSPRPLLGSSTKEMGISKPRLEPT